MEARHIYRRFADLGCIETCRNVMYEINKDVHYIRKIYPDYKIECIRITKELLNIFLDSNEFVRHGYISCGSNDNEYVGKIMDIPIKLMGIDDYDAHCCIKYVIDYAHDDNISRGPLYKFINNGGIIKELKEYESMSGYTRKSKWQSVESLFAIKNVIFNGPATIVFWADGTKTVVKCWDKEGYSEEEAIDQAILKKMFKTNSHHKKVMKDILSKAVVQNGVDSTM